MLTAVKKFYWQCRATKYRNCIWILESIMAEITVRARHLLRRPGKLNSLEKDLILSLTSYPPRFSKLHLTLYSLLDQSCKPDKVVLWIAEQDIELLTKEVLKLQKTGQLEINKCQDLGPGKKILPTLKNFGGAHVVTADDDICYQRNWLQALIDGWDGDQKTVVAHRVHRITINQNGDINPYLQWEFDIRSMERNALNFATGVGGVLYPSGCLDARVSDIKSYVALCFWQDDVWLYWMERLCSTYVIFSGYDAKLTTWSGANATGLANRNLGSNENDICIKKMLEVYGKP